MKNTFILPISAGFLFLIIGAVSTINAQAQTSGVFISEISYAGSVAADNCRFPGAANFITCSSDKWLEVTNSTDAAVNLKGWDIVSGKNQSNIKIKDDFIIPPNTAGVIANKNKGLNSVLPTQNLNKIDLGFLNTMSSNQQGSKYLQVGLVNPQGQQVDSRSISAIDYPEFYSEAAQSSIVKHTLEFTSNESSGKLATNEFLPGNFGTPGILPFISNQRVDRVTQNAVAIDTSPIQVETNITNAEVVSQVVVDPNLAPIFGPVIVATSQVEATQNQIQVNAVPGQVALVTESEQNLASANNQTLSIIQVQEQIPKQAKIQEVIQQTTVSPVQNPSLILLEQSVTSSAQVGINITESNLASNTIVSPVLQPTSEFKPTAIVDIQAIPNQNPEVTNPSTVSNTFLNNPNLIKSLEVQEVKTPKPVSISWNSMTLKVDLPNISFNFINWIEVAIVNNSNKYQMSQAINQFDFGFMQTNSDNILDQINVADYQNLESIPKNTFGAQYNYLDADYQNSWLDRFAQNEINWEQNLAGMVASSLAYLIFLVIRMVVSRSLVEINSKKQEILI